MPKTAKRARGPRKSTNRKTGNRAKVVLNLAGSLPEIEESDNVEAVDDVDSEYLVIHFATPFSDELYRCDVIPSGPNDFQIKARTKEGVGIQLSLPWPKKIKIVCEEI